MKQPIIKINRIQSKDLVYYEAIFKGGNLLGFTIKDVVNQLVTIYGFKRSMFGNFGEEVNLN
jgi:hypothetical protein